MLTLSPGVRLTKSQDGAILLDLDHGLFFHLNPVGARIVELLERGCDRESLERSIGGEFRVSEGIVKRDVDDFLLSLRENRLLDEDRAGGDRDRRDP